MRIFVCFILICQVGYAKINLALNKTSKFCDGRLSPVLTDGSLSTFVEINNHCGSVFSMTVDLVTLNYVHYVVVYQGGNASKIENSGLDFFSIMCIRLSTSTYECGTYPKRALRHGTETDGGMRVNCEPLDFSVDKVQMYAGQNTNFDLAEIEIYTLAAAETERVFYPIGCLSEFEGEYVTFDYPWICKERCFSEKFMFMSLKGSQCDCSRSFGKGHKVKDVFCNSTCYGFPCGSKRFYSLYLVNLVLPRYIGCLEYSEYYDDEPKFIDHNMNVSMCLQRCDGQQFAMLRNGSFCICSDSYYFDAKVKPDKCFFRCPGDRDSYCGSKRYVSVYETCMWSDEFPHRCSSFIHCAFDEHGACPHGCYPGYAGEYCYASEMSVPTTLPTQPTLGICLRSNPCEDIINSKCMMLRDSYFCECDIGYQKDVRNEFCEDIDECSFYPCDIKSSDCVNLNGSYTCDCKESFIKFEDFCIANVSDPEVLMKTYPLFYFFFLPMIAIFAIAIIFMMEAPNKRMDVLSFD